MASEDLFYKSKNSKIVYIGGHGFWGRGVCTPGGVRKNFGGADTGGVEIIFLVDPGVILPKIVKWGVPSGPPGAPPPALVRGVCRVILGFRGGVHPPTPLPRAHVCPLNDWFSKKSFMLFAVFQRMKKKKKMNYFQDK